MIVLFQDRRSSYAFWSHCIAHNIELHEKETSKRNQEGLPIRLSCFHLLDVQPFLTRAENDWIFPSQKLNDIAHFSSTIYLRIYFYLTVKNSNKPCNNNNNDNERNVLSLKEFSIRKTRDSRFLFTRKNSISPARGQPSIDSIDKRPFRTIFNISTDETKILTSRPIESNLPRYRSPLYRYLYRGFAPAERSSTGSISYYS